VLAGSFAGCPRLLRKQRIVRTLMQRDQAMFEDWDDWRLDVTDLEEVLLFALPFSDAGRQRARLLHCERSRALRKGPSRLDKPWTLAIVVYLQRNKPSCIFPL
jgi:hypothetical protein